METYYFDVHDDDGVREDTVGQLLPDLDAVRDEAMAVLPEIAFQVTKDGDHRKVAVIARDGDRNAVYSATLSYSGEWLKAAPSIKPMGD